MNLDWIIESRLASMAMPWPDELVHLRDIGINGILSLSTRIPEGLPMEGIRHLHLPVLDLTAPTLAQLQTGVEFIHETIEDGGAVAVHCTAGLGRTGTFVSAYLVYSGMPPAEAIHEVRSCRPGSVETMQQEQAIVEFARGLEQRT